MYLKIIKINLLLIYYLNLKLLLFTQKKMTPTNKNKKKNQNIIEVKLNATCKAKIQGNKKAISKSKHYK